MCPCPWSPAAGSGAAHSDAGRVLRPPLSWVQSLRPGGADPSPGVSCHTARQAGTEQPPGLPVSSPNLGVADGGRHTPSEKSRRGVCSAPQRRPRADGRGTAGHSSGGLGGRGRPLPPHHHARSPRVGTGEPRGHPWGLSSQVCAPQTACSGARPVPPQLLCCARGPRRAEAQLRLHPPGDPGPGPTVLLPGDSGLQGASTATPALQEGTSLWEQSSLPLFDWFPHPHPASPAPEIYANPTASLF